MVTKHSASKKPSQKNGVAPIPIRALAGRTVDTFAVKALIRETGAVLTRKGRSSNWLLFADKQQMRQIVADIEASSQPSWQWLAKLIREKSQLYSYNELLNLVERNPAITIKQLVAMTDCTVTEARKVMDDVLDL